jgi:hypothetical protein
MFNFAGVVGLAAGYRERARDNAKHGLQLPSQRRFLRARTALEFRIRRAVSSSDKANRRSAMRAPQPQGVVRTTRRNRQAPSLEKGRAELSSSSFRYAMLTPLLPSGASETSPLPKVVSWMPMRGPAMPLVVPGLDKQVIRDGNPCVMNADEEQQHGGGNAKQGLAPMGASSVGRYSQHYACAMGSRT